MMRRLLPFALVIAPAFLAYACSSDDEKTDGTTLPPVEEETGPGADTSPPVPMDSSVADTSKADGDADAAPGVNPIEGVVNATLLPGFAGVPVEGPQWVGDGLYYTDALAAGYLIKYVPTAPLSGVAPENPQEVRQMAAGIVPLGTTLDEKTNTLVTLEVNATTKGGSLVRTPVTGAFPRTGTPIALTFDGGANVFDSPNDIVARKTDGTFYITDPGYQAGGAVITNHIWRVTPTNQVIEIQIAGRPNGIALSPNDTLLYVSFTDPVANAAPFINKYPVNVDGSLGAAAKFADIPPGGGQFGGNSLADGMAVDSAGNVYVGVRTGVEVFKPDGTKWGAIAATNPINGVAFGGADKKTLYMSSQQGLYSATVKVAGLVQ